jgi:iron complex transport system substrate-binding protein
MRICSLLPSATEILFALGLGDSVVGVTHECDFPPQVRDRRIVVTSRLPRAADAAEIDRLVRDYTARGEGIYRVDAQALEELAPDFIITQDLCHVCAASPYDLAAALGELKCAPQVLSLNPHCLEDIWKDIQSVGEWTDRRSQAQALVAELTSRVDRLAARVTQALRSKSRRRVACLEWLDPLFNAGHWVPEMVALAGGVDVLGSPGVPSIAVCWQQVLAAQPEVLVLMPCGYDCRRAAAEWEQLRLPPEAFDVPAVTRGEVFLTDSHSYFSRSGPRVAEGVAILAAILHPELAVEIPPDSVRRIERRRAAIEASL